VRFLANTGFLFPGLPLAGRIRAAAAAGFDGVEFHDEVQRGDPAEVAGLLAETGLAVGALNCAMGESAGRAALPGQERDFVRDMEAAHAAAQAVGAWAIHVVAGRGASDHATYLANLARALDLTDRVLLIEPICSVAIPGYHLADLATALGVVDRVGSDRLRVMFDWFHMATDLGAEGAAAALVRHRELIGHVQLAGVPGRAEPGGEVLRHVVAAGMARVGLEYRPTRPEAETLAGLRAVN